MARVEVETDSARNAKDYVIPSALLALGIVIYLLYAFIVGGAAGLQGMLVYLPVRLLVQVVLGVAACMITVKIMGSAFGYLGSAILKLAAIFVFPSAATFFIPHVGWLIALLLYWGLIEWLFELDAMETIVLAIVIWCVNAGAILLVAFLGFTLH
jgi:hypothetical protein